jgi:hypothetical protein
MYIGRHVNQTETETQDDRYPRTRHNKKQKQSNVDKKCVHYLTVSFGSTGMHSCFTEKSRKSAADLYLTGLAVPSI